MRLILDITNYTNDKTPHSTYINLNKVLHALEKMSNTLFKWFTDNLSCEGKPRKVTFLQTLHKKFKLT